jgi:hypothetical protein
MMLVIIGTSNTKDLKLMNGIIMAQMPTVPGPIM